MFTKRDFNKVVKIIEESGFTIRCSYYYGRGYAQNTKLVGYFILYNTSVKPSVLKKLEESIKSVSFKVSNATSNVTGVSFASIQVYKKDTSECRSVSK